VEELCVLRSEKQVIAFADSVALVQALELLEIVFAARVVDVLSEPDALSFTDQEQTSHKVAQSHALSVAKRPAIKRESLLHLPVGELRGCAVLPGLLRILEVDVVVFCGHELSVVECIEEEAYI